MGTSPFTTLWQSRAALHHAQISETLSVSNSTALQTLAQLSATGMSAEQARASVYRIVDQQAYTMAATDVFYLSSLIFFLLLGLVWLARPQSSAVAGGGGAH